MWLVRFHALANWWKLMQLLGSALSHTACENANLPPKTSRRGEISPADACIRCCIWAQCQRFRKDRKKRKKFTSTLLRLRAACGTWQHAVRYDLTVCNRPYQELTYGYFLRGSFDSSRSVAFAMSYTYAYYDSRYNQFGSWRGLPSIRRAIDCYRAHMIAVIVR